MAGDQAGDGLGGEVVGADVGQDAPQLAHRCPAGVGDEDVAHDGDSRIAREKLRSSRSTRHGEWPIPPGQVTR